jgi:hypothetical protein
MSKRHAETKKTIGHETDEQILAKKMAHGEFFAIDKATWRRACDLGLNPAIALTVLARGTGRDNRSTKWSTNAIELHTGISRLRAKAAIAALEEAGLVIRTNPGSSRPRYKIQVSENPDWIWMPNTIVTGAADEIPPIELIRQTREIGLLQLLGDLYGMHYLRTLGGVDPNELSRTFTRHCLGERGSHRVWGFRPDFFNAPASAAYAATYFEDDPSPEERAQIGKSFRQWTETLEALGLLEFVPHLMEGDDSEAEIIHPMSTLGTGLLIEQGLGRAAVAAAKSMLCPEQIKWAKDRNFELMAPVPSHIAAVQLVGIARLRYIPKTKLSLAWVGREPAWKTKILHYNTLAAARLPI